MYYFSKGDSPRVLWIWRNITTMGIKQKLPWEEVDLSLPHMKFLTSSFESCEIEYWSDLVCKFLHFCVYSHINVLCTIECIQIKIPHWELVLLFCFIFFFFLEKYLFIVLLPLTYHYFKASIPLPNCLLWVRLQMCWPYQDPCMRTKGSW